MLGAVGPDRGVVVRLASVAAVAARFGDGVGPVADAGTESIRVLLEQALIIDAKPTLPATQSS
jgi:hypothetical protein